MTSACGSADVLEALGGKIDLPPEDVAQCIRKTGFGFMFAQAYHPAMKHVAPVRREVGVRTVFNVLGPLTNPAHVQHQILGAADEDLAEKLAQVLLRLGAQHSLVVHGSDGLDEISPAAETHIFEVHDGAIVRRTIAPTDFGLPLHPVDSVRGGSPQENAADLRRVLAGQAGPLRDFTLLNAAAALVAAGLAEDVRQGLSLAAQAVDSAAALERLEAWVAVSNAVD
jgi:anthranilate phosphoribosyltransferase